MRPPGALPRGRVCRSGLSAGPGLGLSLTPSSGTLRSVNPRSAARAMHPTEANDSRRPCAATTWARGWVLGLALAGCGGGTHGAAQPPPAPTLPPAHAETGYTRIVAGAGDSVGSIPGAATATYAFRFKQTLPASDRFTFQDEFLSFYFRPTPSALYFQIQNRKNETVSVDWDRSQWIGPLGNDKVAHASTRYQDRYGSQPTTQIVGLQQFSDYVIPISYLVDPAGDPRQLHRTLFAEDNGALQVVGREFGVDLAMVVQGRPTTYSFRFKVVTVVPR